MQTVKKTAEYTIAKRKDGRYAVTKDSDRKSVNGDEKVAILQAEGLLAKPQSKPAEQAPAEQESPEE